MASLVQVLHFPPVVTRADQYPTHQDPPHRSSPTRLTQTDATVPTTSFPSNHHHHHSTTTPIPQHKKHEDSTMTDLLMSSIPPSATTSTVNSLPRSVQPPASLNDYGAVATASSRRNLVFGASPHQGSLSHAGSHTTIRTKSSPGVKSAPSVRNSPINVQSQSNSMTSRGYKSSIASCSQVTSLSPSVHNRPSLPTSSRPSQPRIKVRSLSHIQSFVIDEANTLSPSRTCSSASSMAETRKGSPQYEISDMPVDQIIEMVAGLLTKIASTNDAQYGYQPPLVAPAAVPDSSCPTAQPASAMAFHGKNVPGISILSYLGRIHKYCPTTYEVFLSLLVYLDRMTGRVNASPTPGLHQANQMSIQTHASTASICLAASAPNPQQTCRPTLDEQSTFTQHQAATLPSSTSPHHPPPEWAPNATRTATTTPPASTAPPSPPLSLIPDSIHLSHFFVVDSFNIHRLIIAGVTCASKFFSDIFYTNSRYAKVGGLPLAELNHLELQFLMLNDFRLTVPLEEMESYATMLVEFYAREILSQQAPT